MEKTINTQTDHEVKDDINNIIIQAIQDVKGKNIVVLDMRKLTDAPTNFFIICEGDSSTQINAISGSIHKHIRQEYGYIPEHKEGADGSRWLLVDYFNTVVHIFHPEARAFYALEDLWSDADMTEYKNI